MQRRVRIAGPARDARRRGRDRSQPRWRRLALLRLARVMAAAACPLLLACAEREPAPTTPTPTTNVILIAIDTLRADRLGSYGHHRDTSPNLDALARDAIRYEHAFSQAPWTTPAIAALMTSEYPSALGIETVQSPLPEDRELLPELLRENGYATSAVVSHSFVTRKWGFGQGFESFDESNVKGHFSTTAQAVTDIGIAWLDGHLSSTASSSDPERPGLAAPFLLFLHYFDPHFAYVDRREFPFDDGPRYDGPIHSGAAPARFAEKPGELSEADVREMKRLYDTEIAATDAAIGELLDHLRARGLYDDALIVVTGDHGEEFLDHGALDHTKTLYNELVRVPLLMKLPGHAPAVVREPVGLIDVYPTIADALGLEPPASARGRSLLLPADPARPIFMETSRLRRLRGVVLGRHKLIVDLESGAVELYDYIEDPTEQRNLAEALPDDVLVLRGLVDRWLAGSAPGDAAAELELSEEERERLKALGYL